MEGDLDVIRNLSGDQVVERAKALLLEVEYWRQVLADCTKVGGSLLDGSHAVVEATVAALTLTPLVDPLHLPLVASIVEQQRKALDALKAIGDTLDGTIDLADGRQKALEPVGRELRRAAGLDDDDDDQAVEQ